jgi:hypothetical protein
MESLSPEGLLLRKREINREITTRNGEVQVSCFRIMFTTYLIHNYTTPSAWYLQADQDLILDMVMVLVRLCVRNAVSGFRPCF